MLSEASDPPTLTINGPMSLVQAAKDNLETFLNGETKGVAPVPPTQPTIQSTVGARTPPQAGQSLQFKEPVCPPKASMPAPRTQGARRTFTRADSTTSSSSSSSDESEAERDVFSRSSSEDELVLAELDGHEGNGDLTEPAKNEGCVHPATTPISEEASLVSVKESDIDSGHGNDAEEVATGAISEESGISMLDDDCTKEEVVLPCEEARPAYAPLSMVQSVSGLWIMCDW